MKKIRILIADDHKLVREFWAAYLNTDPRFEVIASCGDAEEAVESAKQFQPDIILMDINMTPFSGLEATQKIKEISPSSKIIGVSMYSQPAYTKKILQMGAKGYLTKNSSKEEMIEAIIEVNKGNKYICREIIDIISEGMFGEKEELPDINSLTEREIDVVNLVKIGASSKEISQTLNIALKTVEVHRHNILKKLKLKNSASLVNFINTSSSNP
jgi:DNA-binding NarL/FixJ family response regulator